jgi:hypothetical protein
MISDVSPFVQIYSATPPLPTTIGRAALAGIISAHLNLRMGRHTMVSAYDPLEELPEHAV